jgi:type VI secretion system protein ImpJ
MTDARLIPDAVQWHEGMLLSPQHFQQADLHNQALQGYMTLVAAPYGWGVRRLRINEAALMAGRFAVTDLEAVMPDGLLVQHADDTEANAPIL